MNSPYITLAVIISLRSAHAAAIIARATTPVTRSRGRRFARGLIAAIVIPSRKLNSQNIFRSFPYAFVFFSVIGLCLLILCCFCLSRLLKRRRNARGTTDQMYPSGPASALPMQSNGMNHYGQPGAAGYGYGPVSSPFSG